MSVKTIGNLPILYIGDVEKATSKPRPSIYRESREGAFPKPIQLGKRRLAWLESDIRDWVLTRLNAVNDADFLAPNTN
jgi:prophage regulatory protein